jgi:hypothetical protein
MPSSNISILIVSICPKIFISPQKVERGDICGTSRNKLIPAEMANRLISFNLLFLLLLLIPLANSTLTGAKMLKIFGIVTQKELVAVDGNISAVYIIRVIRER